MPTPDKETPPLGSLLSEERLTGQQIYDLLGAMTPAERALDVFQYEGFHVDSCYLGKTSWEQPCIFIT
jgi:hypothetical protein